MPRLFDLVNYKDERLKGAFYYALRDTLVANDLKQASRIAFGTSVTAGKKLLKILGSIIINTAKLRKMLQSDTTLEYLCLQYNIKSYQEYSVQL